MHTNVKSILYNGEMELFLDLTECQRAREFSCMENVDDKAGSSGHDEFINGYGALW